MISFYKKIGILFDGFLTFAIISSIIAFSEENSTFTFIDLVGQLCLFIMLLSSFYFTVKTFKTSPVRNINDHLKILDSEESVNMVKFKFDILSCILTLILGICLAGFFVYALIMFERFDPLSTYYIFAGVINVLGLGFGLLKAYYCIAFLRYFTQ